MEKMVIGKYIRLSQADRDLMKKEGKTESESISHQRDLIQNYINANPELSICRQEEFFDDGFSGTNFDRPSFERLIAKIKTGEINCVIVKDFSRFGRDYIELGDYMERIFPFLGVRFISVNDHYDSKDYNGTTGGIDVVMKNIVYDFYSKDLSVKVKTAKTAKVKRGLYLGGAIPFGLKKHDSIKGKLAIDEEAAPVVKRIFDYAIDGYKCSEIARILNEEGVPTPGQYYRMKHPDHKRYKKQSSLSAWTYTTIWNILKQEMYYGAVVGHKREYIIPCQRTSRAVPRDKQIIVEGQHDAIVSKEEWLKAQNAVQKMKKSKATVREYPLKGVIRCGCCGRMLQYCNEKRKNPLFKCDGSKNNPNADCYKAKFKAATIEMAVFKSIQKVIGCAGTVDKNMKRIRSEEGAKAVDTVRQIKELQAALNLAEEQKMDNIEKLNTGVFTKTEYLAAKAALNARLIDLQQRLDACQEQKKRSDEAVNPEVERFLCTAKQYQGHTELTNDMVKAFIDRVLVYAEDRIEIEWNFSENMFTELM